MKLAYVMLLSLVTTPCFASPSDDCQTEAIQAAQKAFGDTYHVSPAMVRKLPVHAEAKDSPDYAYSVEVNKGSNITGIWDVVLNQQCGVTRIKQFDDGVIHEQ